MSRRTPATVLAVGAFAAGCGLLGLVVLGYRVPTGVLAGGVAVTYGAALYEVVVAP
jgi:hypothetical protein